MMMQQISFAPPKGEAEHQKAIWDQARKLLTEHRQNEALRLVQESSKGPSATRGSAYVFVGALYLSMGNAEDALRNLNRALAIEPTVRGAHTCQGILALQQGDLGKAERNFQAELALDPNDRLVIAGAGRGSLSAGEVVRCCGPAGEVQDDDSYPFVPALRFLFSHRQGR